jgi:hypothetical protein
LAVNRWMEIENTREQGVPLRPNFPRELPYGPDLGANAGELASVIDLPGFLRERGVSTIDFIKIDVDGTDFDILNSMAGRYADYGVLGIGVEVNYFGSDSETGNTFHNIDRFMKSEGFELLDISMRRYPIQDLPVPSAIGLPYPASSSFGRPFQGDAFYARDICAPWEWEFAQRLSPERLAKAAALYAMFGSPDSAAEVLVTFADRLAGLLDVERGLDLLARQVQHSSAKPLSYRQYIAAFENNELGPAKRESRGAVARRQSLVQTAYTTTNRHVYRTAVCTEFERKLLITTPNGLWHHAVELRLDPAGLDPDERLRVAVKVNVRRGRAGVGIMTADRRLPNEVFVEASHGASVIELVTDRLSQTGAVLVRNAAAEGPTELEIEIASVTALSEEA